MKIFSDSSAALKFAVKRFSRVHFTLPAHKIQERFAVTPFIFLSCLLLYDESELACIASDKQNLIWKGFERKVLSWPLPEGTEKETMNELSQDTKYPRQDSSQAIPNVCLEHDHFVCQSAQCISRVPRKDTLPSVSGRFVTTCYKFKFTSKSFSHIVVENSYENNKKTYRMKRKCGFLLQNSLHKTVAFQKLNVYIRYWHITCYLKIQFLPQLP